MDTAANTETKYISFKGAIELLRSGNPAKRDCASATLAHAGRRILPHLVAQAADPKKSATHRIRILKVIEQIGYPSSPGERAAIFQLTYGGPPSVRKAAGRLIRNCLYA